MINPSKTLAHANRPGDRRTLNPENRFHLIQQINRLSSFTIELINERHDNCCSPHIVPWGPYDQRDVEMRADVLCYTSKVLEQDLEVTGPIRLVLHAETDGADTDWTAKLVDVWPSGYAMNLCDGILRARYRDSLTDPTPLEAGRTYRYEIDMAVTGNVFRRGHRIRLEGSSSYIPRFDRNLNTGLADPKDRTVRVARQTVWHSQTLASHVILPVIPSP